MLLPLDVFHFISGISLQCNNFHLHFLQRSKLWFLWWDHVRLVVICHMIDGLDTLGFGTRDSWNLSLLLMVGDHWRSHWSWFDHFDFLFDWVMSTVERFRDHFSVKAEHSSFEILRIIKEPDISLLQVAENLLTWSLWDGCIELTFSDSDHLMDFTETNEVILHPLSEEAWEPELVEVAFTGSNDSSSVEHFEGHHGRVVSGKEGTSVPVECTDEDLTRFTEAKKLKALSHDRHHFRGLVLHSWQDLGSHVEGLGLALALSLNVEYVLPVVGH